MARLKVSIAEDVEERQASEAACSHNYVYILADGTTSKLFKTAKQCRVAAGYDRNSRAKQELTFWDVSSFQILRKSDKK